MRRFLSLGLLLLIGVMSQGCVKKALYEAALSDIAGRDAELASLAADLENHKKCGSPSRFIPHPTEKPLFHLGF